MNRRVSSKNHVEKGVQKEKQKTTCGVNTLSPTLVPTMPTHPSLHSSHHKSCFPLAVALTLSLLFHFWLDDKRRMVCVMSNKHTKVALLFLCQPSFSNHLFLLVTSPHSCPCGVVMSVHAQSMQPMRPSEVSAIITSLWCLVFVVWCPQSPLLFPIHSLHHPLVVPCVVIAWLFGVVLFD